MKNLLSDHRAANFFMGNNPRQDTLRNGYLTGSALPSDRHGLHYLLCRGRQSDAGFKKFDEDKEGKTELLEMVPDPYRKSDRLTAFTMGLKKPCLLRTAGKKRLIRHR